MKKTNKHLIKTYLIAAMAFLSTTGAAVYFTNKIANKAPSNTKHVSTVYGIAAILYLCAIAVITAYLIESHKESNPMAISFARKFLEQIIQEKPELKDFERVLSNEQAMQNLASFVYKNLRESEQTRLLEIIYKIDYSDFSSEYAGKIAIDKASADIMQIIKDHASIHPEFMENLYIALARADNMYIMQNKEISR